MPTINARLSALTDALERRRAIEAMPVDPLSASLDEFESWLLEVEDPGATAEGLGLTEKQFKKMQDYTRRFRGMTWTFRG